jgi:hypothetical protein
MGAYLKAATAFSLHADIMYDDLLASGQKIKLTATNDVVIHRPDRLYADFAGDSGRKRLWYDGKAVTLYDPGEQVYAVEKVPAGIDAMLDFLTDRLGFTPPLSDFLYADPGQVLLEDVIYGLDLGDTEVEGVPCTHLAFVQENIDWQIWIEQGKQRVPRKLVITYKMRPGAPEYVALLSDWDFTTPIADSLFSAEIPAGTTQISFLEVQPPEGAPQHQTPEQQ